MGMFAKLRVPWTAVFVGGLALLAASPLFPAPFPQLSLGATLGKILYVGLLLVLVGGYIGAETRAETERRREQKDRDDLSEARHQEDMSANAELQAFVERNAADVSREFATMNSAFTALTALRGVPTDSRQVQELVETAKVSAATVGEIVARGVKHAKGWGHVSSSGDFVANGRRGGPTDDA